MKKEFVKIITPVDGADSSKKAAKKASWLAKVTGIDIIAMYVVHVQPLPAAPLAETSMYPEAYEAQKKLEKSKGQSILDDIKELGESMGVEVKTKMVEGLPDEEIIKEAKKNDLIVMGSKGTSALDRVFLGSVSEKVLHHASSTVMIVR